MVCRLQPRRSAPPAIVGIDVCHRAAGEQPTGQRALWESGRLDTSLEQLLHEYAVSTGGEGGGLPSELLQAATQIQDLYLEGKKGEATALAMTTTTRV